MYYFKSADCLLQNKKQKQKKSQGSKEPRWIRNWRGPKVNPNLSAIKLWSIPLECALLNVYYCNCTESKRKESHIHLSHAYDGLRGYGPPKETTQRLRWESTKYIPEEKLHKCVCVCGGGSLGVVVVRDWQWKEQLLANEGCLWATSNMAFQNSKVNLEISTIQKTTKHWWTGKKKKKSKLSQYGGWVMPVNPSTRQAEAGRAGD